MGRSRKGTKTAVQRIQEEVRKVCCFARAESTEGTIYCDRINSEYTLCCPTLTCKDRIRFLLLKRLGTDLVEEILVERRKG